VAHANVKLALALEEDLAATRDALAAGVVDGEQARVIARTVQTLPEAAVAADPFLPGRAEKHLIDLAAQFDARALRNLARHVLEVLDPQAADHALGAKLEAEEAAAARRLFLELFDNGDGTRIPSETRPPPTSPPDRPPTRPPGTAPGRSPGSRRTLPRVGRVPPATRPLSRPASRSRPASAPVSEPPRPARAMPGPPGGGGRVPRCSGRRSAGSSSASTRPGCRAWLG
jgi:hypothetical protein